MPKKARLLSLYSNGFHWLYVETVISLFTMLSLILLV